MSDVPRSAPPSRASRTAISLCIVGATALALDGCPPPAPQSRRNTERDMVVNTGRSTSGATSSSGTSTGTSGNRGGGGGRITAPQGAAASTARCNADAPESCNGLDDNCNGTIDEGCGYQGGALQITAAWQGAADIDLRVTDPSGEEIYFGHRSSGSGGALDRDANAECSNQRPTVENVFWARNPPRGNYDLRLVAYDLCNAGDTPVTLSISSGGRVIGTYSVNFTYNRQEAPFQLALP